MSKQTTIVTKRQSDGTFVQVLPDGSLDGGADPRREGVVLSY